MSEYFKSAFSNLSSQLVGAASSAVSGNQWSSDQHGNDSHQQENSFVGQTVELKGQKIRIDRVIAEGRFQPTTPLFLFLSFFLCSQLLYSLILELDERQTWKGDRQTVNE